MLISVNDDEIVTLREALKMRNRDAVNKWVYKKTRGRIVSIDDRIYEGWIYLAQGWTIGDLKREVIEVITKLK